MNRTPSPAEGAMKKRKKANPSVTKSNPGRLSRAGPESSTPAYHPATGQVLSKVKDDSPYIPKQPRQKAKIRKGRPTVTIAPGLRSTRDVIINRR